jgi:hypothetical protein
MLVKESTFLDFVHEERSGIQFTFCISLSRWDEDKELTDAMT